MRWPQRVIGRQWALVPIDLSAEKLKTVVCRSDNHLCYRT